MTSIYRFMTRQPEDAATVSILELHNLCPLPALPEVVASYIAEYAGRLKVGTIQRRLKRDRRTRPWGWNRQRPRAWYETRSRASGGPSGRRQHRRPPRSLRTFAP